ncbi:delta-latroinsectotoxin-Lt1a-like isoform X2 [Stegodyphus dumicola]|uniref:delta-latroinsectotoxin-Lt1a-like isoform X2 n=1 Tax=Stegodyphus dumicola TaxID=202533 RepID=UPI0015AEAA16|nr:delta-latroinsectotoxin-Lt1a-like isoform X2 [Stegodyphus dumicola]
MCLLPEMDVAVPVSGISSLVSEMLKTDAVLSNILLHVAIHLPDYELARLLLEKGANINSTDRRLTALHKAVCKSDYELTGLLLDKGADVNRKGTHGKTALHFACERAKHSVNNSNYELIRLLLEKGADVTRIDIHRETALHVACQKESSAIIKLLTEKSPAKFLNLVGYGGCTPFDYACRRHSPEVLQFLLLQGSSVVSNNSFRDGPLMNAVSYNKAEYVTPIASMLLEAGAKIHHQLLVTAVKRAITEGEAAANSPFLDLCTLLIHRGCDLNAVDYEGRTALHIAVRKNHEILVRKFLISGNNIEIDKRDREGFTPLRYACEYGYRRLVNLLIIAGASLRGQDWETAFEHWRSYKMLKEEKKKLYNYVIDISKQCLSLENLCYMTIRKNIRNVEKDAIKLRLPPLLVERLKFKL